MALVAQVVELHPAEPAILQLSPPLKEVMGVIIVPLHLTTAQVEGVEHRLLELMELLQ